MPNVSDSLGSSERIPSAVSSDWTALVARLLSESERRSDGTACFRNRTGVTATLVSHENSPVRLVVDVPDEGNGALQAIVHFDLDGVAESVVTTRSAMATFDNGIRRGPDRRSLVSQLAFRQNFSISGDAVPRPVSEHPDSFCELHVHTASYVGGNSRESANSFLEYGFDEFGEVCPVGNPIADRRSHFLGSGRVSLQEVLVRDVSEEPSVVRSADLAILETSEETSAASVAEGRVPYRIEISPDRIEVRMGDRLVGGFSVLKRFGFERIESALFPEDEKTAESVVRSVGESVDGACSRVEASVFPKTHHEVRIEECGEPLVEIPNDGRFVFADPHPYVSIGAPYGESSPYALRSGVLAALEKAALLLEEFYPGHRFKIYDAYRPVAVQAYMVEHVADEYCRRSSGVLLREAEDQIRQDAYDYAHGIWAPAVDDPSAPPPHSTGSAIDLTIVDAEGRELDMGSPIDDPVNAHPESFAESDHPEADSFHQNRMVLCAFMESCGFVRLPHEWWHFSLGDQRSTFVKISRGFVLPETPARYGRV